MTNIIDNQPVLVFLCNCSLGHTLHQKILHIMGMQVDSTSHVWQISTNIIDAEGNISLKSTNNINIPYHDPSLRFANNIFHSSSSLVLPVYFTPTYLKKNANWPLIVNIRLEETGGNAYLFIQPLVGGAEKDEYAVTIIAGEYGSMSATMFEELKEAADLSEDKFRNLIETLPDAIFIKDGDGRWQTINSVARDLFRLEHIDWQGKTDLELAELNVPMRKVLTVCAQSDNEAWKSGALCRCEESVPDENGNFRHFDTLKLPVFEQDGSRKSLIIVGRDITTKKEKETDYLLQLQIQEQTNKILKASLENRPLEDCLRHILERIIESPFINVLKQGGIFLTDESGKNLKLVCHLNFPEQIKQSCYNVPFGKCICGKAADKCQTVYVNCVNDQHDVAYEGMNDHGHYSVPILYQGKTLGVLMVYIEAGHQYKEIELRFLDSVANIIAGLIHRRKAEEQVLTNINFLEELEKFNVIFQNGLIHDDLNRLNKEVLEALLETFGADRAWLLYPCDANAESWSVPMECTRKEYPGAFEMGKEFPMTDEYRLIFNSCLNSADAMVFGIQNDEEHPLSEFELAKKFTIKAGVAISLKPPKGRSWLLGMHQCSYYRIWTNEERKLLKQIAERYAYILNSIVLLTELKKSETQYRSLAETARDIIITCNGEGRFTYINSIGLNFTGLNEAEAYEKTIFDFIAECDPEHISNYFSDIIEAKTVNKLIELNLRSGKGEIIPFEVNSSLIQLENGKAGITSVIRNITDRKHSEEQLLAQNSELQIINRELDQFVYSTSHDLRAPLTSVMGLINIALDSISDHEEVSDCLHMMETSIMRLDNVIKSIIGYSKNKRLSLTMEPIDMKDIFNNIMESISFLDDLKKVLVYSDIDTTIPFLSNRMRIETILSNLINNAIKYRRDIPDSYVKVIFRVVGNDGVITVEDNGEGVPVGKQEQIFEMFYRNSLAADGSGLGLYIVRQNIIKLNGSINLVSEYGKGSTFKVIIPMAPSTHNAEA